MLREPDPQVMVADELLHGLLRWPDQYPALKLVWPAQDHGSNGHAVGFKGCEAHAGRYCFCNSILKIHTSNLDVVYQIREYEWECNAWTATWPD